MSHRGRGLSFLALGVMGLVGAVCAGCHFNVSYSFTKPPAPPEATANPDGAPALPPDAVTPVAFQPGSPVQPAIPPAPPPGPPDERMRPENGERRNGDNGPPAIALLPGQAPGPQVGPQRPLPTELAKVSQPPYVIEPPDVLLIDAVRLIPRPPYRIEPLDVLTVQATQTFPDQPIAGAYAVGPDGTVALGFSYGAVRVAGLTLEEAQKAILQHLSQRLKNPQVVVGLAEFRGLQQIRGEHLVRPDGTISLGTYGCVYVTGLTLAQAKTIVEQYLSQFLLDPQVAVDVIAYNSKAYYVIADGAGYGQTVFKFPATGNETVLDAINNIGGIPAVGSKRRIWVARPAPANHECLQLLPVDWLAIAQGGSTRTNYQLFPGDRVYIKGDALVTLDNTLAKLFAPVERVLGITLLGASVARFFQSGGGDDGAFIIGGF